ncbi:MAG TPA: hypothetical protein VJ939_04840 [Bacteroidales bacterium]|nr:hypothetical protein [Bacteroidales bacterium]
MIKPHKVNVYYSLFLIALALFGFFARYLGEGDMQFTALIPAVFGIILLPMTGGIKRDNRLIGHISALVLVIVLFGMIGMFFRDGGISLERKSVIFQLVTLSTIYYLFIQVRYFIRRRKGLE